MRFILIAIFPLLLLISCKNEDADQKAETSSLLQADINFAEASKNFGAAEAFRQFLAENAIQFPAAADPVKGNSNIFIRMKNSRVKYQLLWVPKDAEVARSGDLGYTWGEYTFSYKSGNDSLIKENGHYVNVWRKNSRGDWKVVIDIGN